MKRWWRRRAVFPAEPSPPPVVSELERVRQERIDVLLDLFEEDIDEELADRAAAAFPDDDGGEDDDGGLGDVIAFNGWGRRG